MISNNVAPIEQLLPEKRVTFYNLSWHSYEQVLAALQDKRASRLTYYQGILEIVTSLEAHESASDRLGILIHILAEELNLNIKSMASTTLNKPTLKIGAEPDKCYYIQNEPAVRGKAVNLATDPPPDLILEIDITHTDIDKNKLYQDIGLIEFWRYNGKNLNIYLLKEGQYQESKTSSTFSILTKAAIYEFLAQCHTQGESQGKRNFRNWVRKQIKQ